jgi:hypothetical protein
MKRENGLGKNEYLCETEIWKKSLDSFLHENALLKTKLAKVLDENNSKIFLATAEDFQNFFIAKDDLIKDISSDISAQKELINTVDCLNNTLLLKQQKLRNEMIHFEKSFSNLRVAFARFLADALLD